MVFYLRSYMNLLLLGTSLLRIRVAFNLKYHLSGLRQSPLLCRCFPKLLSKTDGLQNHYCTQNLNTLTNNDKHCQETLFWKTYVVLLVCFTCRGRSKISTPLEHFGKSFHGESHRSKNESKIWVIELPCVLRKLYIGNPLHVGNKVVMF